MADAQSWLGRLAEETGAFAEAGRHYAQQAALLEELVRLEPRTARWKFKLGEVYLLQTDLAMVTGEMGVAGGKLGEASRLLDELVALDASNRRWTVARLIARLMEANLAHRQGDPATAARLAADIRPRFERLAADEPSSRVFVLALAKVRLLESRLLTVDLPGAADAAKQAVAKTEALVRDSRATRADIGDCARASVVAGEIAAQTGDATLARMHWQRAEELLRPRLTGSRDWRLLDPAARAAAHLGRIDEARSMVAQLERFGYVPLDPWPREIALAPAETTIPAH
jgi:tetratricopeptide (TPR) repeat protein